MKLYIPESCLLVDLGGNDTYSFAQDCKNTGSSVLLPALWVLPEAKDYYPTTAYDDTDYSISQGGGSGIRNGNKRDLSSSSVTADQRRTTSAFVDEESKAEWTWMCPHCSFRNCKICRVTAKTDDYYGGWKPLNMDEFPDP